MQSITESLKVITKAFKDKKERKEKLKGKKKPAFLLFFLFFIFQDLQLLYVSQNISSRLFFISLKGPVYHIRCSWIAWRRSHPELRDKDHIYSVKESKTFAVTYFYNSKQKVNIINIFKNLLMFSLRSAYSEISLKDIIDVYAMILRKNIFEQWESKQCNVIFLTQITFYKIDNLMEHFY